MRRCSPGGRASCPLLAMRLARPTQLVDINEIDELAGIRPINGTGVAFGALTRERTAEHSPLVAERAPLLAEALPFIGHVSIRNRGTIGGSIAHADASAETARGRRHHRCGDGRAFRARRAGRRGRRLLRRPLHHVDGRRRAARPRCGSRPVPTARAGRSTRSPGATATSRSSASPPWSRSPTAAIGEARIALMGVADRAVPAPDAEAALVGQTADAATIEAAAARSDQGSASRHPTSTARPSSGVTSPRSPTRRALTTAVGRAGGAQ